jgi:hypothetical protein
LTRDQHTGQRTFSLEQLSDLILNEQTRLQKAGIFVRQTGAPEDTYVLICDRQRSDFSEGEAASFWTDFLGTDLSTEDPAVATAKFKRTADQYINEHAPDGETQTRWGLALTSYMASPQPVISVEEFADSFLEEKVRDSFVDYFREHRLPTNEIPKDISHISRQLSFQRLAFDTGVVVIAPADDFNQHVEMKDLSNGMTEIKTRGILRTVDGRRST